ncbi:NADH dehydrogenase subunit 3 (mitochondrion) [Australozyma saopauloensis]|uniref:NADH-ubiquinone oxidoreductase chain 3 n=1 Tax=Australozyma saopauloensis TaxID=291208 RepID=A0AAX4HH96_9ASCO|nr:NADH dehydrogenase subunit 3 [[Candida] saopauloensis]
MFTMYMMMAPMMACALMMLNYLMSKSNGYMEKDGPFECGFTSYQQSRSSFNVTFMLVAMLFLPFDLEMSSILPYVMSAYNNGMYGLMMVVTFLMVLVMVFMYEMRLNAMKLDRKYESKSKEMKTRLYS